MNLSVHKCTSSFRTVDRNLKYKVDVLDANLAYRAVHAHLQSKARHSQWDKISNDGPSLLVDSARYVAVGPEEFCPFYK